MHLLIVLALFGVTFGAGIAFHWWWVNVRPAWLQREFERRHGINTDWPRDVPILATQATSGDA